MKIMISIRAKSKILQVACFFTFGVLIFFHGYSFANYDECILNNMKNATNPRSADYVAQACKKRFGKKSENNKDKSNIKRPSNTDTNDSGSFKFTLDSAAARPYVKNLSVVKRRDYEYDFQETKFEIMNKNYFGISTVFIGITEHEDCGEEVADYSIIYECSVDQGYRISAASGGSVNCGRQITEGVCVFGFVTEWLLRKKDFLDSLGAR